MHLLLGRIPQAGQGDGPSSARLERSMKWDRQAAACYVDRRSTRPTGPCQPSRWRRRTPGKLARPRVSFSRPPSPPALLCVSRRAAQHPHQNPHLGSSPSHQAKVTTATAAAPPSPAPAPGPSGTFLAWPRPPPWPPPPIAPAPAPTRPTRPPSASAAPPQPTPATLPTIPRETGGRTASRNRRRSSSSSTRCCTTARRRPPTAASRRAPSAPTPSSGRWGRANA